MKKAKQRPKPLETHHRGNEILNPLSQDPKPSFFLIYFHF